ncbi:MAG TPA: sigma-70 family RNA polymerase sigma factor [Actinophytocola sp.]|uniref:sigma-70 family RNA polymerase sigma factor n=1 Tax=Actinophytocola sp. TaxID=1872138 RepID=UPI002DB6D30B|nr:sigma-70 family RNA polymerase sigma factor [Actinophytocola sp.]HEU5474202.1 sigma-70 family RNA polymerase sigma factor [Actinophytocola sp.]
MLQIRTAAPTTFDANVAIETNLPLVGHLVREILARVPAHVRREDLFSAGSEALVNAARAFDPERGIPFTAFATMRVRGALLDELRGLDWASRSVRGKARRMEQARDQFVARHGRTPNDIELATQMETDITEVVSIRDDVQRSVVLSLQGIAGEGPGGAEVAVVERRRSPEEVLIDRERIGYLHDAISALPERLRRVIEAYYFQSRPMAELAEELEVTESRVSQLRAEATALLRDGINAQLAPELVDTPAKPDGCAARRRASYYAAIAATSVLRTRLAHTSLDGVPVNQLG